MEFCPKCGAVLVQKRKNDGCPRCSYTAKNKTKIKTSEKVEEKKPIAVIKGKEDEVDPIVNEKCKNCGHNQAYFWTVQTRASDESETKFFKCTKCGETRRDYS
ncbi:MAG: transcription factor S [Candidatus Pacearchaeota archaeon]